MSEEQGTATEAPEASQVEETNQDPAVEEATPPPKPEKTEEQRALERMQRGIDRKTRQAAEARARAELAERRIAELEARLTPAKSGVDSEAESDADGRLTLTPAELARHIEEEARKIAPTIAKQVATEEQLREAAHALKQELGDEFDELTEELDDVLPRDKQLALLSSKNVGPLVRYLANPDNSAEVKRIAAMSDFQAGMAIHELELKLAQKAGKPKPSKAAEPLDEVKAEGASGQKDPSRMTDREFNAWRRAQIRARNG